MITECDDKTRGGELNNSKNSIDSPPIKIVLNHSLFFIPPPHSTYADIISLLDSLLQWPIHCHINHRDTNLVMWHFFLESFYWYPIPATIPKSFPWLSSPWVTQTLPTAAASSPDHPSLSLNISFLFMHMTVSLLSMFFTIHGPFSSTGSSSHECPR